MTEFKRKQMIHYLEFFSEIGVRLDYIPIPNATVSHMTSQRNPPPRPRSSQKLPTVAAPKDLFSQLAEPDRDLPAIREDLGDCKRCKLHSTRKNIVFGSGDHEAKVMFIGEAPGADEDEQGLPFVGRAGKLLTKIIESVGFRREEVYITNILKCRPPGNRNPENDEVSACQGFLFRQIDVIQPIIICALGTSAAQTLMRTKIPISKLRGNLMDYRGTKLIATFHPAYLLRNPIEKRKVWEDIKMLRAYYDERRKTND